MASDGSKVCINCGAIALDKSGARLTKLYDETLYKKSKILKLVECRRCGEVVDNYSEYEGTIILLDLALQNIAAYRHVLVNNTHNITILKMTLITLIVEGYCRWAGLNTVTGGEFFEQEYEFYLKVGESLSSLFVYLCVSLLVLSAHPRGGGRKVSLLNLLSGLLLAYSTRFLQVVALLWATHSSTDLTWAVIEGLFYLTSARVFQVLTGWDRGRSLVTMASAHLASHVMDKSQIIISPVMEMYLG